MIIQEAMDRLRQRTQMPLFAAGIWDAGLDERLRAATPEELFGDRKVGDPKMAMAALAGLHLWNDNFQASHLICQGIATPTGSYWHGLCHRREGHQGEGLRNNLSNAKYWFRQTGDHPAFDAVYRAALNSLDGQGAGFRWATEAQDMLRARRKWDPFAVIDWFGQIEDGTLSPQTARLLEEIQWREIGILVDWCVEQALEA